MGYKLELGNLRLERAGKMLVLATDNKDTKLIARYETMIKGTKSQIEDAQNSVNLTAPDKEIIVKDADLERIDETEGVNWANLFGEEEGDEEKEDEDEQKAEGEAEDEMDKEEEEEEGEE